MNINRALGVAALACLGIFLPPQARRWSKSAVSTDPKKGQRAVEKAGIR